MNTDIFILEIKPEIANQFLNFHSKNNILRSKHEESVPIIRKKIKKQLIQLDLERQQILDKIEAEVELLPNRIIISKEIAIQFLHLRTSELIDIQDFNKVITLALNKNYSDLHSFMTEHGNDIYQKYLIENSSKYVNSYLEDYKFDLKFNLLSK